MGVRPPLPVTLRSSASKDDSGAGAGCCNKEDDAEDVGWCLLLQLPMVARESLPLSLRSRPAQPVTVFSELLVTLLRVSLRFLRSSISFSSSSSLAARLPINDPKSPTSFSNF